MPVTYAGGETETVVAKIGETGYATLADAIADANGDTTIKLVANTELTESLTVNTTVTLDLAGCTITGALTIGTNGNLTIDDSMGDGKITSTGTTITANGGTLTLNGGTIHATNPGNGTIQASINSAATVNINGGAVKADAGDAIKIGSQSNATLNVNNGSISAKDRGILLWGTGTVNIAGGTVSGNNYAVYTTSYTAPQLVTITGGTVGNICYSGSSFSSSSTTSTLTIGTSGGSATDVTIPSVDLDSGYATVYLYSGTVDTFTGFDNMTVPAVGEDRAFLTSTDISGKLPKSEQRCVKDESTGLYYVTSLTVTNAAAKVLHDGVETPYNTVGQAVTALQDGDTLTLNTDYTGTIAVQEKNIVIDLGGHTVTATGSQANAVNIAQSATESNTVTVKNGHLVAKDQSASAIHAIMNDATSETLTLALENVTLELSHSSAKQSLVRLGNGARTAVANKAYVTNGGLQVAESDGAWIYGTANTAFTHANGSTVTLLNNWYNTDYDGAVRVPEGASYTSAVLDLNGHTIEYYGSASAIAIGGSGNNYVDGTNAKSLTVKNGTINANSGSGAAIGGSNKTLILDGVTLTTTGTDNKYGIFTNGMTKGNTVTLTNSSITAENCTGIYFPGAGKLTVENTNVTGGVSGIEIRAGVLDVSGDSAIKSTAAEFKFEDNDNGTTTTGAAIAAVKHGVGNDLTVNIDGGTFSGLKALYQADPNADKAGTVTMKVTGGTFNGAVTAETVTKFISGGTFTEDVDETYLADGYVYNAADKTVKADTSVAAIGTTKYASLAAAIKAANTGDTITLLKNITLSSAQSISSKKLTLDLNGKVLNGTGVKTVTLSYEADLTVEDSVGGGKISNAWTKTSGESAAVYLSGTDSQFTLNSGTIESTSKLTSLDSVAIRNSSGKTCTVNINGGSVVVPEAATDGRAILAGKNMTLNVSGGTIAGGLHGVDAYSGSNVTITGGEITARVVDTGVIKEAYGMRLKGTANVTVDGGTITGVKMDDNGYNLDVPKVTLKSGEIKGSFYSVSNGTITFTVAPDAEITFANDTVKKFLPDTVELVETPAGTYGVAKAKVYVAAIGTTKYETLKEAIDAANTDDTITLLDDVDLDEKEQYLYSTDKKDVYNLTFDLNGHKITSSNDTYTVSASRKGLVIKNGTIENTASKTTYGAIYATFSTKGTHSLRLENVTVIAKGTGIYATTANGDATVTIGDKTTINAATGIKVVGADAKTRTGTLKLNVSAGTVTGTKCGIHVTGPTNKNETAAVTVTITGGEVSSMTTESGSGKRGANVAISGGTVTGALKNAGKDVITITGGTFKGAVTKLDTNGTISISGGTFAIKPDTTYLVKGYTITGNADNTYGVKKTTYVAEVNGTQYESLQAAIAAAKTGDTVKLIANFTTDASKTQKADRLTVTTDVTLDLNGCTLTIPGELEDSSNWAAFYINGATMTVKDSSANGTGAICGADKTVENPKYQGGVFLFDVNGDGALFIESGTYYAGGTVVQVTQGTATVNGGSFSVYPDVDTKDSRYLLNCIDANYKAGTAHIVVNGGTFVGYDPRNNKAEGEGTDFVAPGVGVNADADGNFVAKANMLVQLVDAEGNSVAAYDTLGEAFEKTKNLQNTTLIVLQDITDSDPVYIGPTNTTGSITLDLNDYNISFIENKRSEIHSGFNIQNATALDFIITGKGTITAAASNIAAIRVQSSSLSTKTTLTIEKDVTAIGHTGVMVDKYQTVAPGGNGITVNIAGTVKSVNNGIGVYVNGSITEQQPVINVMSTARIEADSWGMYLAGNNKTTVASGAQISGTGTGIEIRAGELTLNDCTVTGGSGELWANTNGSGTTVGNAAVAVSQHNTDLPITVTVNGGTYTGTAAFYQFDGRTDTTGTSGEVKTSITRGTFLGQVAAETGVLVITGGSFSTDVAAYCATGYQCNAPTEDEPLYTVTKQDAVVTVSRKLTLANNLIITYTAKMPVNYAEPYAEFNFWNNSLNEWQTSKVEGNATGHDADGNATYTFAFTGVNPQRMNDTLKMTLFAKTSENSGFVAITKEYTDSVAAYCNAVINNSTYNVGGKWTEVLSNLVAYGAASQKYMKYNETALVTDSVLNCVTKDYTGTQEITAVSGVSRKDEGITITSVGMVLSSSYAVRVFFTLNDTTSLSDVTFTANIGGSSGQSFSEKDFTEQSYNGGTRYYFDYTGLNARQLDSQITFTATVSGTPDDTLGYSANTYLRYYITNPSANTVWNELVKWLFNYGWSCKNFK